MTRVSAAVASPSNNTAPRRNRKRLGGLPLPALPPGAGTVLLVQAGGLALGYAAQVLLARWMGAAGYGTYVYAMGWAVLLSKVGSLGLPTAALRFVPAYERSGEAGRLFAFLRSSRQRVLAAGSAVALLGSAAVLLLSRYTPLPAAPLALGVGLTPLLALVVFETEALRALRRVGWAYAPPRLLRPLLLLAGAGALALTGRATALGVLAVAAAALLVVLMLQRLASPREQLASAPPAADPDRRQWLRVALPLLLTHGFLMMVNKTDLFFVGAWLGPSAAAYYHAAVQTAHAALAATFAVDVVAAPAVSRSYADGDREALQRLATRMAHWYFWPTLATGLVLAAASPWVLALFGPGFARARPALLLLLLGLLANAATGVQRHLLSLTGHERDVARVYGGCALINVPLNALGLWLLGLPGAAPATATTMGLWSAWMRALTVRRLGIRPSVVYAALRLLTRP